MLNNFFYRYKAVQYATLGIDGDFVSPTIPNPKLQLETYNLWKETPKGYWIGFGHMVEGNLRGRGIWVSKTSKKKFAYSTKKEALENFIKRNEARIRILKHQQWSCEIILSEAKNQLI